MGSRSNVLFAAAIVLALPLVGGQRMGQADPGFPVGTCVRSNDGRTVGVSCAEPHTGIG